MELNQSYWYEQASRGQQHRINDILLSYRDVFTDENQKVGRCDIDGNFRIELEPGTKPVKSRDRSLKPDQLESLRQQLKDWTADSVIRRIAGLFCFPGNFLYRKANKHSTRQKVVNTVAVHSPTCNFDQSEAEVEPDAHCIYTRVCVSVCKGWNVGRTST